MSSKNSISGSICVALGTFLTAIYTRLGILLDLVNKLKSDDGAAWQNALKKLLKKGVGSMTSNEQQLLLQRVYDKYFQNLNVAVPDFEDAEGFWKLYIAQGLTCDMVYAAFPFKKWKCTDGGSIDAQLDLTKEVRRPSNGSYLIQVLNGAEPDAKYLGKSTHEADMGGKLGTTLLERIFFGLVYFELTGKHLDIVGLTFCSGSRYLDGFVPSVFFGSGEVVVDGYGVDGRGARYGVRKAVSVTL